MKYTLFLLLAFNILIAQDHEPAQRPFDLFGNSNYYIDPDTSSYFNTNNEILLGWQWDESYQTAQYFNTNFTTQKMWDWDKITNVYTTSFFDEGARFLAGTGYLAGDIPNYFCFTNLQSMWWEPTLLVGGEYDLDNFRFADKDHLVSGFLEINGEKLSNRLDGILNKYRFSNFFCYSIILC